MSDKTPDNRTLGNPSSTSDTEDPDIEVVYERVGGVATTYHGQVAMQSNTFQEPTANAGSGQANPGPANDNQPHEDARSVAYRNFLEFYKARRAARLARTNQSGYCYCLPTDSYQQQSTASVFHPMRSSFHNIPLSQYPPHPYHPPHPYYPPYPYRPPPNYQHSTSWHHPMTQHAPSIPPQLHHSEPSTSHSAPATSHDFPHTSSHDPTISRGVRPKPSSSFGSEGTTSEQHHDIITLDSDNEESCSSAKPVEEAASEQRHAAVIHDSDIEESQLIENPVEEALSEQHQATDIHDSDIEESQLIENPVEDAQSKQHQSIVIQDSDIEESHSNEHSDEDAQSDKQMSENLPQRRQLRPRKSKEKKEMSENEEEAEEYHVCYHCKQQCKYYCPSHGIWLKTKEAPTGRVYWPAKKTTPEQLAINMSGIPNAGMGIWSRVSLPHGTLMGPFTGTITRKPPVDSTYVFKVQSTNSFINAKNPYKSNYMRYINCARHAEEENVESTEIDGNIYYRTLSAIQPHEELLLFYNDGSVVKKKDFLQNSPTSVPYSTFICAVCKKQFRSPLCAKQHCKKSTGTTCRFCKENDQN